MTKGHIFKSREDLIIIIVSSGKMTVVSSFGHTTIDSKAANRRPITFLKTARRKNLKRGKPSLASSRNEAGGADDAVVLSLDFVRNGNETEKEFDIAGGHHHGASAVTAERTSSFALPYRLLRFEHWSRPHPFGA